MVDFTAYIFYHEHKESRKGAVCRPFSFGTSSCCWVGRTEEPGQGLGAAGMPSPTPVPCLACSCPHHMACSSRAWHTVLSGPFLCYFLHQEHARAPRAPGLTPSCPRTLLRPCLLLSLSLQLPFPRQGGGLLWALRVAPCTYPHQSTVCCAFPTELPPLTTSVFPGKGCI